MSEAFTGHRIVKAYNLEGIAAEKFRSTARRIVGHYMRNIRAVEIPGPLIEFFGSCGVAFVLWYLITHSESSHPNPTDFLQLVASIFSMYQPLKNTTRDLRNQVAVVTQETVLFNDTIGQNIELGRPGATREEIIAAAKHAFAHEFVTEKPEGYDTVIGEKGVMLSGGQRQRLAIARA